MEEPVLESLNYENETDIENNTNEKDIKKFARKVAEKPWSLDSTPDKKKKFIDSVQLDFDIYFKSYFTRYQRENSNSPFSSVSDFRNQLSNNDKHKELKEKVVWDIVQEIITNIESKTNKSTSSKFFSEIESIVLVDNIYWNSDIKLLRKYIEWWNEEELRENPEKLEINFTEIFQDFYTETDGEAIDEDAENYQVLIRELQIITWKDYNTLKVTLDTSLKEFRETKYIEMKNVQSQWDLWRFITDSWEFDVSLFTEEVIKQEKIVSLNIDKFNNKTLWITEEQFVESLPVKQDKSIEEWMINIDLQHVDLIWAMSYMKDRQVAFNVQCNWSQKEELINKFANNDPVLWSLISNNRVTIWKNWVEVNMWLNWVISVPSETVVNWNWKVWISIDPIYWWDKYLGTWSVWNLWQDWNRLWIEFITYTSFNLENLSWKEEWEPVSDQLWKIVWTIVWIPSNSNNNLADIQWSAFRKWERISKILFWIDLFNTQVSNKKLKAALSDAWLVEDWKITENTQTIDGFIDIIDTVKRFDFSTKLELVAYLNKQDKYKDHPFVKNYVQNHWFWLMLWKMILPFKKMDIT